MIYEGFEPIYNDKSEVLILGSFPSIVSRRDDFYYAHPSNRFWRIMGDIYNCDLNNLDKAGKRAFLLDNNIALWDIVNKCSVSDSSDLNIKVKEISDIIQIFKTTKIKKILCNGRLSYNLTRKHYCDLNIPIIYLPSTSSANRVFDISKWSEHLR